MRRTLTLSACATAAAAALGGFRSCHTNELLAGRRVTDFAIRRGRVTRVTVGFVID